jgi:hypothetical protein
MDSGYPTREVVKTASPEILDFAPKDLPWKTGPSYTAPSAKNPSHTARKSTNPDRECSPVVRDRRGHRAGNWHGTTSTSLNCSHESSLLGNSHLHAGSPEACGLYEMCKHIVYEGFVVRSKEELVVGMDYRKPFQFTEAFQM